MDAGDQVPLLCQGRDCPEEHERGCPEASHGYWGGGPIVAGAQGLSTGSLAMEGPVGP